MANVTASEQLMLELMNLARLDPAGEAQRLGIDLNQGLAAGTITAVAKQPLAFNNQLVSAARSHSLWQIANDVFSHTGAGGSSPGDRMTAAGYVFEGSWGWGENISWRGVLPGPIDPAAAIALQHDDLFLSPGHRANLLDGEMREAGVGQGVGVFTQDGKNWSASVVTQDFAVSGSRVFVTGVVYRDSSGDGRYSLGEGLGSWHVGLIHAGTQTSVQTNAHGGYESAVGAGPNRISFQGPTAVVVDVYVADQNVKVDLAGTTVRSSANLTLVSGAGAAELLGVAPLGIAGSAAAERLTGNRGSNSLAGGGGADTLNGGAGADTLRGGAGDDTYVRDHAGDVIIELAGQGIDTVQSSIACSLAANTENLLLTGGAALNGSGNGLHNRLTGNAAANVLSGLAGNDTLVGNAGSDKLVGGPGNDSLVGGLGKDVFRFDSAAHALTNKDTIAAFSVVDDTIQLENAVYAGVGVAGSLAAAAFWKSATATGAHDATDRIVYNTTTGALYYDPDGTGPLAKVQFATLAGSPDTVTDADFQVT